MYPNADFSDNWNSRIRAIDTFGVIYTVCGTGTITCKYKATADKLYSCIDSLAYIDHDFMIIRSSVQILFFSSEFCVR